MKKNIIKIIIIFIALVQISMADEVIKKYKLFDGGRFPGLISTGGDNIVAVWGDYSIKIAVSDNGGQSFPYKKIVETSGINSGGGVWLEGEKKIIVFGQPKHPISSLYAYTSSDLGRSWNKSKIILPDQYHDVQLHFGGAGRVLKNKICKGRIVKPARVYGKESGYNVLIFSDDNGLSWSVGNPYPELATGEGSVIEINDNKLLYTSRRHWYKNQKNVRSQRSFAVSYDCGETWKETYIGNVPDGPRYRDINKPMGPTHNGHFGLAGSLEKLEKAGEELLFYTNVDRDDWKRKNLALFVSKDDGKNWKKLFNIHEQQAAYSSMVVTSSRLVVHFEGGEGREYEGSYIASYPISHILNKIEN